MSVWLFFALLAPALFGFANILDKVLTKRFAPATLNLGAGLFAGLALIALPFIGIKLSAAIILFSIFAGGLWLLAGFPYFKAISIEEVSRVIPLWQLAVPMTLVLAVIFLGERLHPQSYVAMLLIFLGAFLISARNFRETLRITPAFWLMMLACALVASASVMAKWLYSSGGFLPIQVVMLVGNFVAALVILLFFRKMRQHSLLEFSKSTAKMKIFFIFRMFVDILAYTVYNLALLTGPASLTAVLDSLSGFFVFIAATFISAWWPALFREELDRKALLTKAAAILMIIAGLFLLVK